MAILNSNKKAHYDNLLIRRYTLQIDDLNEINENDQDLEWEFRDTLLKCLYSTDFVQNWSSQCVKIELNFLYFLLLYIIKKKDFKWQIQIRTNESKMKYMTEQEDLFKV